MGQWFVRAASVVAVVSLGLAGKWAVGCASGESDSAPVGQVRAALVLGDAGAGTPLLQTATAQRLSDRITQRCNVAVAPGDAGVRDAAADGAVALAAVAALDAGAPSLPGMPTASELAALVAEAGAPTSFTLSGNTVTPAAKLERGGATAQLGLGASAGSGFAIGDPRSSMRLRVTVDGLADVPAEAARDRVAYPEVSPGVGWTVSASASGIEDTFQFESGPNREDVLYHVALENVAGLRLVDQTLEFMDASGDPRLRVSVPVVLDGECNRVAATLSVEACAVSSDPSAPWGKPVVPPGASQCDVRVSWAGKGTKYPLTLDPAWSYTNAPYGGSNYIYHSAAAVLNGDKVLLTGGVSQTAVGGAKTTLANAAILNPTTNTWTTTTQIGGGGAEDRYLHTATTLADGRVLVIGGRAADDLTQRTTAWLFDGTTWSNAGSIGAGRSVHTATLLNDGRVLVFGGQTSGNAYLNAGLVWSSAAPTTWTVSTPTVAKARFYHTATVMSDGRVLIAGGYNPTDQWLDSVEIYIPSTGLWQTPVPMHLNVPRYTHFAGKLKDGKILVAGGGYTGDLSSTEIYDPQTNQWSNVANDALATARFLPRGAVLANGKVMVVGGSNWGQPGGHTLATTEIFDPNATGARWSTGPAMIDPLAWPTTVQIGGGRLVIAHGIIDMNTSKGWSLSETLDLCADTCADGNACTADQCGTGTSCANPALASGTACDDTNVCNGRETCDGNGSCLSGPPPNVIDGNPCTEDRCDPVVGLNPPINSGPCDDGNACTTSSVCQSGQCVGTASAPAGTRCKDDGDPCNGAEVCNGSGQCTHPGLTVLPNPDPCVDTSCVAGYGFVSGAKSNPAVGCNAGGYGASTVDLTIPTDIGDLAKDMVAAQVAGGATAFVAGTEGRRAMVSGRVYSESLPNDGGPPTAAMTQGGVVVSVLGHPEFGTTATRGDGRYDLAVLGGATYTIRFQGTGFFEVQRTAAVDWQDWASVDDVVLVPNAGSVATGAPTVTLGGTGYVSTYGPTIYERINGVLWGRRPFMVFPPGSSVASPAGLNGVPLHVGFTDMTQGPHGLARMVGALPPASAYTEAMEIRLAKFTTGNDDWVSGDVSFSSAAPPVLYLDNFTSFDVGTIIPAGYYDRDAGAWLASNAAAVLDGGYADGGPGFGPGRSHGRVVKITAFTGTPAAAELDTDGDGLADNCLPPRTNCTSVADQIPIGERQQIASLYAGAVGAKLWRVPVLHLSNWDKNLGFFPPAGAPKPKPKPPKPDDQQPDPLACTGSIVECENQSLGEKFRIPGTPFSLRYRSDWQRGRQVVITIPVTDTTPINPTPTRIDVNVRVAGRLLRASVAGSVGVNQSVTIPWDRLDGLGREVAGTVPARVEVGYVYQGAAASYGTTSEFGYAANPPSAITGNRDTREVTLWADTTVDLHPVEAKALGFGGMTLDVAHSFDAVGRRVIKGDGTIQDVASTGGWSIESYYASYQGAGTWNYMPSAVAVGGDGAVYVANELGGLNYIYRYPPGGGAPTIFAGNGNAESAGGDPGNCAAATGQPVQPVALAVGADDAVYVATRNSNRIRRIKNGVIETIAGSGTCSGFCDGRRGRDLALQTPSALHVGADGSVYVGEVGGFIRKLTVDPQFAGQGACGTAYTQIHLAGLGAGGDPSEVGAATAQNVSPTGLTSAPDGTVYFTNSGAATATVWSLTPAGVMRKVAGGGTGGDGGPALSASLNGAVALTWSNGSIYLLEGAASNRLRIIDKDGVIRSLSVDGVPPANTPVREKVPLAQERLREPKGIAVAPDRTIFVVERGNVGTSAANRTRRISPPSLPGCAGSTQFCIPSPDGREVYLFDTDGRHLSTKDAFSGVPIYTFTYETAVGPTQNQLKQITDRSGLVTTITRTSATSDVVITPPFGPSTAVSTITRDANGYANALTLPISGQNFKESTALNMDSQGLLLSMTRPGSYASYYTYDGFGRLVSDKSAGNTKWLVLQRDEQAYGHLITMTSPERRTQTVRTETSLDGGTLRTLTAPDGVVTVRQQTPDLKEVTTRLAGAVVETSIPGDAGTRFGMMSPESVDTTLAIAANANVPNQPAITNTRSSTVVATLSNPADVLSTTSLTETTTVSGTLNGVAQPPALQWTKVTTKGTPSTVVSTSPAGRRSQLTLDAANRVTKSEFLDYAGGTGFASVSYAYNTAACTPTWTAGCGGRLTSVTATSPLAGEAPRTYQLKYDYGSSLASDIGYAAGVVDPASRRTTFGAWNGSSVTSVGRDEQGRVTKATLPDGTVVDVGFDTRGNTSSVRVGGYGSHAMSYDQRDLLIGYQPPQTTPNLLTKDTSYARNDDRQITMITEPWDSNSRALLFGYDQYGRVSQLYDTASSQTVQRTYNAVGQLWTANRVVAGATVATWWMEYVGDLPASVLTANPTSIGRWEYDHLLRVVRRTVGTNLGSITTNETSYDADSLVSEIRFKDNNSTLVGKLTYARDPKGPGAVLSSTTANTVASAVAEGFTYNGYAELSTQALTGTGGPWYQACTTSTSTCLPQASAAPIARDALGRITSFTEVIAVPAGSGMPATIPWTVHYDAAGRIDSVTKSGVTTTYGYDAHGNRTQVNGAFVGTYDAQDRLTALSGTTYTYTNRGTLTGIGSRTFTYDLSGGLLSATAVTGGATVTYALDAFGRRVQKSVSGVLQAQWVYDERGRILAEYDGSIVRQVFGYGARSTPELMYQPTTGHLYRLVSDWRGSVRLVLDLSAGSTPVVKQRIDYDAWGVATEWVASDPAYRPVSLGFAGGLWDRDTGLVRFGARDYDPATGRWTAKDPIRFSGGLNLYVYCYDDAFNFVDKDGRDPTVLILVGEGAGAVGLGAAGAFAAAGAALGAAAYQIQQLANEWDSDAFWGNGVFDPQYYENRGRGERNQTGKPDNPDKHLRWDPKKQRWYERDNQTGKPKYKPPGYRPPPPPKPSGVAPGENSDDDEDACE